MCLDKRERERRGEVEGAVPVCHTSPHTSPE
jgi:hypothetical protein